MSQNINDDIDIPEDEMIDQDGPIKSRKPGYSPAAKIGMMIGVGVVAMSLAYVVASGSDVQLSETTSPPNVDATPGGSVQSTSPEYQESLRQENERRANLAGELGVTFTPTPEILLQQQTITPVQETETVEAEPAPQEPVVERQASRRISVAPPEEDRAATQAVAEVTPEPETRQTQQTQTEQPPENPYIARMIGQMGIVAQRQEPRPMQASSVARSDNQATTTGANAQAASADAAEASSAALTQDLIFRPGDVLYGETLTTVSSDDQAPVLVEIMAGPQKGARLVGEISANRQAGNLVVNFTSMALNDGSVVAINAFAVDGKSAEMAVASDVERRYLQRYGPILAASFISAYAQARSQPARSIVGVGENLQIDREAPTTEQSLFAGLGAASNVIANDILQSAPVGPKIILRAGYPIAILMVEPVSEAIPVAPAGSNPVATTNLIPTDMRQN